MGDPLDPETPAFSERGSCAFPGRPFPRAHFAVIVESSPDAIISSTLDGTIATWNPAAERLFGHSAAAIVGRSLQTIVPADRTEEELAIIDRIRRGERVEHWDTVRVHQDGRRIGISLSAFPIPDEAGRIVGASIVARASMPRSDAQEMHRTSEQRLAEAQKVAHIGSWELDLRTHLLTWSDEHFRLFGLEPRSGPISYDEALAHLVPEDAARVRDALDSALREQRPFLCDFRVELPDGSIRFMHGRGEPIPGADGQPVRFVGTAQDVTDRKRIDAEREALHQKVLASREKLQILSRRLIQAQEEERRRLARELHDELGQVLTAVSLSLEHTIGMVDEAARGRLRESMAVVDRAIDQVRSMSLNLRPAMLDVMGLESALRWFVDRQARATGVRIEFASFLGGKRVAPELETSCFRIVQESLTNAARHAHARNVRVDLTRDDAELLLTIQDDGDGFDVANAQLRSTAGASFGLSGMEERVRLHGGELEIDSAFGRGTTVCVRIPLI